MSKNQTHIVRIHPVGSWGKPNLNIVEKEFKVDAEWRAKNLGNYLNCIELKDQGLKFKAVYHNPNAPGHSGTE